MRGLRDGVSGHNVTKLHHPVPEVNEAFGRRRFRCLPTEISAARDRQSGSAGRSNALGDGREVSRGHTSWRNERECTKHSKVAGGLTSTKGRTDAMGLPGHPPTVMNPPGGARHGNGSRAEKESPCASVAVPCGGATHVPQSFGTDM